MKKMALSLLHFSHWTPKCIQSGSTRKVMEPPYMIVPIVVCYDFKIIMIEKTNLPNGKNEGSYSSWGHNCK